tara:strand:- start:33252 stop:34676 length:1425 start_codon:yes stop_codon:yes gene_type:complete
MKITLQKASKIVPKSVGKDVALISFSKDITDIILEDGVRKVILATGKEKLTLRKFVLLARKIVKTAQANNNNLKIKTIIVPFDELFEKTLVRQNYFGGKGIAYEKLIQIFVIQALLASYSFTTYKSKKPTNVLRELILIAKDTKGVKDTVRGAKVIAEQVNKARELSNMPGGEMTPKKLAAEAKIAARGTKVSVKSFGRQMMRNLKMGAILGVSAGSKEEPQLITLTYNGGKKSEKPVVLIGKGVTFDSGGLSLKPAQAMLDMYLDMSAGASVIHTVITASKLGIKENIIGIVPAAENMISGESFRPGDILKTMSGQTVEVQNTDAEGRLILADALTYAKKFKPKVVLDLATLTGTSVAALGQRASAVFSNDDLLAKDLVSAGEVSADYAWRMPLWEEYENEVKSTYADWSNVGRVRYGDAIHAAVFLHQFAKDFRQWAHIDIAPRMVATDDENLAKGSVGAGVLLLIEYLTKS